MYSQGYACIFTALIFLDALPAGRAETKLLTVPEGQFILLPTLPNLNLQDESEILWSFKPEENAKAQTLVHLNSGKWYQTPQGPFSGKVKLNETSGALTLGPVGVGHSGYYHGQITEGDDPVHPFRYKISVMNPGPASTTEPPRNISKDPLNDQDNSAGIAAAITFSCLFVLGIILSIIIKVCKQKKKETNSSSSPSISMDTESGTQQPAPNVEAELLVVEQ